MKNIKTSISLVFIMAGILCCTQMVLAQMASTEADKVIKSLAYKQKMMGQSMVKNIPFQNIGPTIMSGRVVDVDVNPNNTTEFYVAFASGGLWYSNNNGTSFTPVMDNAPTQNIGDIAVDWKAHTIWVGTGENNSSRSSYAGIGILKSNDKGNTWENVGLTDSHHIGRIVINPDNSDEIVVAVIGHLYSQNEQRGIFKSVDGGKTWKKTLYINDATGIIDLAFAPDNFNIMFVAAWERDRKAWHFDGDGTHSGIYKSTDGGDTWALMTNEKSGFPTGEGVGRIGLAAFDAQTIYALLDNQYHRPPDKSTEEEPEDLNHASIAEMTPNELLSMKDKKLNTYIKKFGMQEKFRSQNVKNLISGGLIKPSGIPGMFKDANKALFDTPVIGAEVYRSNDGGLTWKKMNEEYIDDFYFSYGYYFGQIRVDGNDKDKIYIAGVPILKSIDGGKTYVSINKENVHVDHHGLWINKNSPGHLILGNDGGLNISYDDGATWVKCNSIPVGQYYAVNVDYQRPYNVYGGFQDNGVWMGPANYKHSLEWHGTGIYPYKNLLGGDGMKVEIDNRKPYIVYTGFQFGNYYRINTKTLNRKYIQPKPKSKDEELRFNWQTPIFLSKYQQDILYLGSNKLHRSFNRGDDWEEISPDLTQGGKEGNVAYGTLTTLSESPFQFGLIYTGSDDGLVHITKDGGHSWNKISDGFKQQLWVSRVVASAHQKERVYVTLNGYRWDDFTPYVYVSEDYGKTWSSISSNLPLSPINVIREDPVDEKVLYLGTDNGLYVSFDKGNEWHPFSKNFPNVAAHDLVIQQEYKEMVVATHGRSLYKTYIAPLQEYNTMNEDADLYVFELATVTYSPYWGSTWSKWLEAAEPKLIVPFYSKNDTQCMLQVLKEEDVVLNEFTAQCRKGFNYFDYDMSFFEEQQVNFDNKNVKKKKNGKYYLPKGIYTLKIQTEAGEKAEKIFTIE